MLSPVVRTAKEFGHAALHVFYEGLLSRRTFVFDNEQYTYFYHPYNNTCETERSIEIPIALAFLGCRPPGPILEVGNVLNHYVPFPHTIVDKYEVGADVANLDIADIDFPQGFASIVSISTMEHVGWDEDPFEPGKAVRAITRLRSFLLPGGQMLISFPIGHNAGLDHALEEGSLGCKQVRGMKRRNLMNDWMEVSVSELMSRRFAESYRRGAVPYRRAQGVAFACFDACDPDLGANVVTL